MSCCNSHALRILHAQLLWLISIDDNVAHVTDTYLFCRVYGVAAMIGTAHTTRHHCSTLNIWVSPM